METGHMNFDPVTDRETIAKAFYGDGVFFSKKEEKKQEGSGFLAATNGASAALGAATFPALARDLKDKMPKRKMTAKPKAPKPPSGAARAIGNVAGKLKATPVGSAVRGVKRVVSDPKYAAPMAGVALGGALFNAGTDAASAVALRPRKKDDKVKKSLDLKPTKKDDLPMGTKLKLKAVNAAETKVRETLPRAGKAADAAVRTWKAEAKVSKALPDKRQVYGWASITEMNGLPVVDLQGDYVTIEEIEKAAHAYISKSRKGGDMHLRNGSEPKHVADLIESVVITPEKKEALGLPPESPTGWWVGFQVNDDEIWDLVKDGKRPMFSIHGSGRRIEKEMENA